MKRKVLFIFALLCAVAQGAWAQNATAGSSQASRLPEVYI